MLLMLYVEEIRSSGRHPRQINLLATKPWLIWNAHVVTDHSTSCFVLGFFFQVDKEPARNGAHTPNIRLENLKENSSSVCTSTRRNACSCPACSTSPTGKWRSGSRTVEWRRRNWTGIGYSITRPTRCFRGRGRRCPGPCTVLLRGGTERQRPLTLAVTLRTTMAAAAEAALL